MRAACAISGILLSVVFVGAAVAADEGTVYLWVDKDGTPHYQDRPPEGTTNEAAKELSMRYKLTDGQAIASAKERKAELDTAADLRKEQQTADKTAEETERQTVADERAKGCQDARDQLQKYETAHRLYKPGPNGERTYLSDEEIDAARANARKTVDDWCAEE